MQTIVDEWSGSIRIWKCPDCQRRYKAEEMKDGGIILARLHPRKKPRYKTCCFNQYHTYVNTRWRGRAIRVVFTHNEPVNNNYHELDKLWH